MESSTRFWLHSLDHGDLPLRNDRDVNDLVNELLRSQEHGHLTLHNNGQINNLVQDLGQLHGLDHGHLSLNNNGHVHDLQLWNLHGLLHDRTMGTCRCTTAGMSGNLVQDLQLWKLYGQLHGLDHGPVVEQRRACPRPATVESPRAFCTVRVMDTCRCTTAGMTMNCKLPNLNGFLRSPRPYN